MIPTSLTSTTLPPTKTNSTSPSWRVLALYLVVSFGGYFLVSFLLGKFVRGSQVTLPLSILAYTLNLLFFGGTVLLFGTLLGSPDLRAIGFLPPRLNAKWFLGAIAFSLALLPLRGLIGVVVQLLASGNLGGLQNRMDIIAPAGFTWVGFLATWLGAGILVPISEELFFRGALFTWFRQRFNFPIALIASSALFALGHFDTIGVVASSLVLAVANACIFEKTKTLWAPILMHITTNSFAILFIYAALALNPNSFPH